MAIAFFDLDKTLLPWNSASAWVRSELRHKHITRGQALRGYYWILRYQMGFARIEAVYREAIAVYCGVPEEDIVTRTRAFYETHIRGQYRPGARKAIEAHRRDGDHLALLTSSSTYLSRLVADELELDEVICNRFEVDARGCYTGRPVEPMCVGAGKRLLAEEMAERHRVSLRECYFYTDSVSDLPALEAVGHPVAVHPDPRLRRLAQARGWRIAEWGVPA